MSRVWLITDSIVYMICSIRFKELVTYIWSVLYKLHATTIVRKTSGIVLLRKQRAYLNDFNQSHQHNCHNDFWNPSTITTEYLRTNLMTFPFLLYPVGIYLLKVNTRNTRTMCEICSKLTIKNQSDVNKVVLVSLLLTLNRSHTSPVFALLTLNS